VEYTHIQTKEDSDVLAQIQHIPVRAGSAVFWDNRIPHANSYCNDDLQVHFAVAAWIQAWQTTKMAKRKSLYPNVGTFA
jgi:hypothetical protein